MSASQETSRTPLTLRKSVFLRVKRDRSVAPPPPQSDSHSQDADATATPAINVRIGGVTYHFERMTEKLWEGRKEMNNISISKEQSAPQKAHDELPTKPEGSIEKSRTKSTSVKELMTPESPDDRSVTTTKAEQKPSGQIHSNVEKQRGPKFNADVSKDRNKEKLLTDAQTRRNVLRLSSVQCCRLGRAISQKDSMGVLISAVEQVKSSKTPSKTSAGQKNPYLNASAKTNKNGNMKNVPDLSKVRPDDIPLVMAGIEADEIMDDLYEQIMAVEMQLQKRGGRTLRDDELDALIRDFKKKSEREKEKDRAPVASLGLTEGRKSKKQSESFVDFDYYVLIREDNEEEADGYTTANINEERDYDLVGDDDESTMMGADGRAMSTAVHFDNDRTHEEDMNDEDDAAAAAEHLTYNFDAMTLQPHYQQQTAKWQQQPVDVAIWENDQGGGATQTTNGDDFDFTEVAHGPQNTYHLQAPTIRGNALAATSSLPTQATNTSVSLMRVAASHMRDFIDNNDNDTAEVADSSNRMAEAESFIASFFGKKVKQPQPSTALRYRDPNTLASEEDNDAAQAGPELVLDDGSEDPDVSVAMDFFSGLRWKSGDDDDYASYQRALRREEKLGAQSKPTTLSSHLATNVGAEDPEVVYQQDDEYDSNAEDHYGNEYADESSGSETDSEAQDSDHDDDLTAMGFGDSNFKLQQKNKNGWGEEESDDDDDEEFQGFDRYGDLGHRHVAAGADYDQDSSDGDYTSSSRKRAKHAGNGDGDDEGFDDYGRVADDDDDNYNS